jgi:hypothetical protein
MASKRRRDRRERETTGGPSPAWMGSAVLLALVAAALVFVLIHAATSSPTPAPPAAASPGASPGVAPPGGSTPTSGGGTAAPPAGQEGRPAGCSTTGTEQTVPTSPPAGVTWTLNAGFAVPSSPADGPTLHGAAGVAYCYSHTPLGALLAASNLGRGTGTPQEIQNAVLNLSVVPNEYSAQVANTPATADDQSGAGIQFAGFRIISYSPDQASMTLATRVPGRTDTYPQLTVAMQWYAGDWRAVPQAGPALFVAVASAPSLAGFVPWAGVS